MSVTLKGWAVWVLLLAMATGLSLVMGYAAGVGISKGFLDGAVYLGSHMDEGAEG